MIVKYLPWGLFILMTFAWHLSTLKYDRREKKFQNQIEAQRKFSESQIKQLKKEYAELDIRSIKLFQQKQNEIEQFKWAILVKERQIKILKDRINAVNLKNASTFQLDSVRAIYFSAN